MPELLDEIIDETTALAGELLVLRRQISCGEKMAEAELAKLKRHTARIISLLQAFEVEH